MMTGLELREWRKKVGWTQADLMAELEVGSRQTVVTWEKSASIPRLVELAILALDRVRASRNFIQKSNNIPDHTIEQKHWHNFKAAGIELGLGIRDSSVGKPSERDAEDG